MEIKKNTFSSFPHFAQSLYHYFIQGRVFGQFASDQNESFYSIQSIAFTLARHTTVSCAVRSKCCVTT